MPGFRVVGKAYSAAEALEQARLTRPDVVLMDVYLPDGDGLQVIRQLLEEPEAPIVLVVSAAAEVATVRRAVQLGAVHYLVKPFGFAALAERLTAIRSAQAHFDDWPADPTQEDISRIYDLLRLHMPPELAARLTSIRRYDGQPIPADAITRPILELETIPA